MIICPANGHFQHDWGSFFSTNKYGDYKTEVEPLVLALNTFSKRNKISILALIFRLLYQDKRQHRLIIRDSETSSE